MEELWAAIDKAGVFAVWGSALATVLAIIKIWETFLRDKIRLVTTYSFDGREEMSDTVSVVNLSSVPVMVSRWTLEWKPRWFRKDLRSIDVTPDFIGAETTGLKISPHEFETIEFADMDKFDWGYKMADGRRLMLTLHLFGKRRPIVLLVHRGL